MSPPTKRTRLSEFVRSRRLEDVPLDEMVTEEGKTYDEHFSKLYRQYSYGKLPAVLTRVDISSIQPGVFKRLPDGSTGHFDFEAEPKVIEWLSYEIRCGFRPVLFLYKGIFGESVGSLVCADDVNDYHAYRSLGIRKVPAIVFGKNGALLKESGICVRIKNGRMAFDSAIANPGEGWRTYLGSYEDLSKLDPVEAVTKLAGALRQAAACIRAFHIDHKPTPSIHYHHCLYSTCLRLLEIVCAVELLLKGNLAYQIRPLVRSAYDLFLNFHLDWLSPEHNGRLLQGLAALSRSKGRLSPLGAATHSRIYGELSPAVHQDFAVAQEYADSLLSESVEAMSQSEIMANIRWLDIVTVETVTRLLDDVGASDGTLKEWPELEVSPLRHVGIARPMPMKQ